MKNNANEKGITLVALVVTIIVLLILAGVSLSLILGDNGIITRAQDAVTKYKEAESEEQWQMDNFMTPSSHFVGLAYDLQNNGYSVCFTGDSLLALDYKRMIVTTYDSYGAVVMEERVEYLPGDFFTVGKEGTVSIREQSVPGISEAYYQSYTILGGVKYIVIPPEVNGTPVLGVDGFDRVHTAGDPVYVFIPSSVQHVDRWAFRKSDRNCAVLGSVGGTYVFRIAALKIVIGLEALLVPAGVETIPLHFDDGCSMLESVILPTSLKKVSGWALKGSRLKDVVVENGGDEYYESRDGYIYCSSSLIGFNLKSSTVDVPEGTREIDSHAFSYMSSLHEINFPDSIEQISSNTFKRCGIQSVTIPGTVDHIGYQAFSECDKLRNVRISPGVQYLADYSFADCSLIEVIYIPDGVKICGNAFKDSKVERVICQSEEAKSNISESKELQSAQIEVNPEEF